jgi:hypothetical protein
MKNLHKDLFLEYACESKVSPLSLENETSEYNCVPLKLETPLENIHKNLECLTSWMERFFEENLPKGISPLIFYPLGIIAGTCFANPRGNSTVVVSKETSKGFSQRHHTKRWGECCIMIHGLNAEVVYDRHSPGSFAVNQCKYFPRFSNASNTDHACLMQQKLERSSNKNILKSAR